MASKKTLEGFRTASTKELIDAWETGADDETLINLIDDLAASAIYRELLIKLTQYPISARMYEHLQRRIHIPTKYN